MGHKRKASDSQSPFSSSSPPSNPSPSLHNINSAQTFPSHASNHTPLTPWASSEGHIPSSIHNLPPHPSTDNNTSNHLNSRTRKRFRDNRPDEAAVHQATLSKLYAAQHRSEANLAETQDDGTNPPLAPSPSLLHTSPTPSISPSSQQKGKARQQTSLHAFFDGGGGGESKSAQLDRHKPTASIAAAATACCEDCSTPLALPLLSTTADTDMMDVDDDREDCESSAFSCASCSKRVCDICAVRANWRLCLACANPGSGNGNTLGYSGGGSCGMEAGVRGGVGGAAGSAIGHMGMMGGKRWVGGIGWC